MNCNEIIKQKITLPSTLPDSLGPAWFEKVVNHLNDAIIITEAESCDEYGPKILWANDVFYQSTGYTPTEVIGKSPRILQGPLTDKSALKNLRTALKNWEDCRVEVLNYKKDGSTFWNEFEVTPIANEDGYYTHWVSVQRDVTARKRLELEATIKKETLCKSKQLLKETGAMAGVGAWEVDLTDNSVRWSEETYRIYGLPNDYQPQLDQAINYYAPEARPIIQAAIKNAIETGEGWDLELPLIQADGTPIWVRTMGAVNLVNDKPVRLIGAFQNITENINQRLHIENINARMALATDSGGIGVWEYNLVSERVIWDERMFMLYGLTSQTNDQPYEILTKNLHPEDKQAAETAFKDGVAGKSNFNIEFRVIWNDGSVHHLRASARAIRNDEGHATKMIGVNWDITPQRALANELAQQHELMRVTLQSIGDAVITTDAKGSVQWLNPVAENMTGWSSDQAFGLPLTDVFHIVTEETRMRAENPVATCLEQRKIVDLAKRATLISRCGDEFGIEDSAAPILNKQGKLLGVVLIFRDVSEQRRLHSEMSFKATHDALTGLVNRVEFETRLHTLLKKTHETGTQHALMFIDLDQFKIVNDTCGHSIGDDLLQQVAKILSEAVRNNDTLARLGGDEFGIILEQCTVEQAQRVGQKICDQLEDFRFIHGENRFRIGSSIGLVAIDNSWSDISSIMQAADTSCYAAKDAGRNRVHIWFDSDETMQARHGEKQWTTRIERALDENRFVLYAQLLHDLTGKETGIHAEVLLRMLDNDGGIIFPNAFLPAAERFHLASRIDRWVLRNAIDWLINRRADDSEINMLFINLSGQSVGDSSFHAHACEIFRQAGSAICEKVCLEITETAAITNMADASLFITQLNQLGVKVALDDFGAGAASFGYLKHLNIDILKIDGQFISDLLDDPLDDVAVRFFIEVARVLNLKTVAEFVDKPEVLARIKELGIDYAQGFLLHKPEPINLAIEATLED
jgi:diguanylate cyclase (GGDEF)-like protein/PAS domain S-box-containing protein